MNWILMVPDRAWELASNWGPAIVVMAGGYLLARRLLAAVGSVANTALREFLVSHRAQSEAITKLAACFEGQTAKNDQMMERILVGLQVLHQDVDGLRDRLEGRR
jgi:hypothetical protein